MTFDTGAGPLGKTHPHYRTTHGNQRHIPGMNWESLTTLQTENERENRDPSLLEANRRAGRCPDVGVPHPLNTIER